MPSFDNQTMSQVGARKWIISGVVQGVGFRFFVQRKAAEFGLNGWARNLEDGRVEVYAWGPVNRLEDLASALHVGPPMADVRSVEQRETALQKTSGFSVR